MGGTVDPTSPLANRCTPTSSAPSPPYMAAVSVEALLHGATRMEERATAAGVDVTLSIGEGRQHAYPFLAGRPDLVAREFEKAAAWYRK